MSDKGSSPNAHGRKLAALSLGALGVVFGDIGTSPLYAFRECLHGAHGVDVTKANVLGVLSLIFWALMVIISVKYVAYVLRADNQGEGGILALMALVTNVKGLREGTYRVAIVLGLVGASLLFGDGIITPAISVLGALEGIKIVTPDFDAFVVPLAVLILFCLFYVQKRGTGSVGAVFGPVMIVWFGAIALVGAHQISLSPQVLQAMDPSHAWSFLATSGHRGFIVLGSVFLAVTGGEALYADLGHFGARPVRVSWFLVALPGLMLNYFGQGALLLRDPNAVENPFYRMVPAWGLIPMVVLATLATVIASQALITGSFSLARQAMMLGYFPRVTISHTSAAHMGQIYVPVINWLLMLSTISVVLGFRSSSALAAAYGVAVTLDMLITTLLAYVVARRLWGWGVFPAVAVTLCFLLPESVFASANLAKVKDGGWFPLVVGAVVFTLFTTWRRGRDILNERFRERMVPLEDFLELMRVERATRVPGMAVFMNGSAEGTPPALLHNFLHNRVVHEHVVLLTIVTEKVARVPQSERATLEDLSGGFRRVVAHFGFMETPDVPALLDQLEIPHYALDYVTFFLGRETLLPTHRPGMALWRERLFAFLARNAQPATAFFGIPPSRVVEIGAQIEL